jgi:hypothetical protein
MAEIALETLFSVVKANALAIVAKDERGGWLIQ